MFSASVTRRKFATGLAPVFSAFGLASLLPKSALAKNASSYGSEVSKLNDQGKPADGTQMITPIVAHNGLGYWRAYYQGVGQREEAGRGGWRNHGQRRAA